MKRFLLLLALSITSTAYADKYIKYIMIGGQPVCVGSVVYGRQYTNDVLRECNFREVEVMLANNADMKNDGMFKYVLYRKTTKPVSDKCGIKYNPKTGTSTYKKCGY